jgi:hypothetical protein
MDLVPTSKQSVNLYDIYLMLYVHSLELMMDGQTVWNMQSGIQ